MKLLLFSLLLIPLAWSDPQVNIYARRGEFYPPTEIFDLEELNSSFFDEFKKHQKELKRLKFYLINGELRLASVFLSKIAFANTKLRPIIHRYLSIIHFIDGNFKKSSEYLKSKELNKSPHYSKICVLKIINSIVLDDVSDLEENWSRCKIENYTQLNKDNSIWIDTLVELKTKPRLGITKIPFQNTRLSSLENEELKLLLKLSLYLNQEKILINDIQNLSSEQLRDHEIRELVGQIFFRTGAFANAFQYLEDLKSPNSESIKGNLYVLRGKYELAYAQFKLALEQKRNSQNALERLIPLAWILGDWQSGVQYAERMQSSSETFIQKLTLAASFQIQKTDFEKAETILEKINEKSRRSGEVEVSQLSSFVALMRNNPKQARKSADISCSQYDVINCWTLYQLSQWDGFPKLIRRKGEIKHKTLWEKLSKEEIQDPIKELVYINQVDIEELDEKLESIKQQTKKN